MILIYFTFTANLCVSWVGVDKIEKFIRAQLYVLFFTWHVGGPMGELN